MTSMPFIGVRISWLIVARKSDFALVSGFGDVAGDGKVVRALLDRLLQAGAVILERHVAVAGFAPSMSLKESTSWPVSSSERRSAFWVKSLVSRTRFIVCASSPSGRVIDALQARGDQEADRDRRDRADRGRNQRLTQAVRELGCVDQEIEAADSDARP